MHVDPAAAALLWAALYAAHRLGDYWLQSDHQATTKHVHGSAGRWACFRHVATLTLAQALAIGAVEVACGLDLPAAAEASALGLNAATHYWADRRRPLRGLVLATEPITRKLGFYENGGAAELDQAWHVAWLLPVALIAAAPAPTALLLAALGAALLAACAALSGFGLLSEHTPDRDH